MLSYILFRTSAKASKENLLCRLPTYSRPLFVLALTLQ